jgi:hypothetical protein
MKVYFSASISGKKNLIGHYRKIFNALKKMDVDVLSDHVLKHTKEEIKIKNHDEVVSFYRKIVNLINKSDVVIIEASYSSTNLGHEITLALEKGKPTIVLYIKGSGGARMLEGSQDDRLFLVEYELDNLQKCLSDALQDASDQMDVRFNFFIPPQIVAYLDWIAKNKKIPRAVFLRRLIEGDMNKNKDYKG